MSALTRAARCAALAPVILALACDRAGDAHRDSTPGDPVVLDGSQWELSSMNGHPLIERSRISMNFVADGLGGYGGCNWYGARYTVAGDSIRVDAPESTARGCPVLDEQERLFFRALRSAVTYRASANRLEMVDSAGAVVLTFSPRPRTAIDPAALVGTRWRLRSVADTAHPTDSLLTLAFTADSISGFGGCRSYTGTYHARGDEISITSIAMTSMECNRGLTAQRREDQFTTDMSEATYYRLRGDTLEIVTAPGRRVMFVARP